MSKNNRYRIVIEKSTITIASHEKNDHRQCLDNILYHKDTIGRTDGRTDGRGRILARKSVFCYRTPDFVNGFFVALDDIFDLAPSDRFLNFLFPSYGVSPSGLRLENLHFFTLHPYNPHFLESDGSDPMRTYVPHILR